MTIIRRINVSQIGGASADNTDVNAVRPRGELAVYENNNGKLTLMMFDGERVHNKSKILSPGVIYGANADSGDGNLFDTLKLIPDAELYANGSNQYLVVDPTGGEPGHIHLRAGGTQDASSADLYLGGELTFVRVSDTSDTVTIRTTNIGDPNITLDWSFQPDGNLYFPGIGNNRIGESEPGLVVSSDNSVVLQSNNAGTSKEWYFGTDGNITFPDSTVQSTAWNANTANTVRFGQVEVGTAGGLETIIYNDGININGSFALTESSIETFTGNVSTGNLIFADSSVQTTAYTGFTANSANWSNPAPTTLNDAIDRLAILVKTLNSGTGA